MGVLMACLGEFLFPAIVARPLSWVFMRDPSIVRRRTGEELHPACQPARRPNPLILFDVSSETAARRWGARTTPIDFAQRLAETHNARFAAEPRVSSLARAAAGVLP
jgi:hypothetical protein